MALQAIPEAHFMASVEEQLHAHQRLIVICCLAITVRRVVPGANASERKNPWNLTAAKRLKTPHSLRFYARATASWPVKGKAPRPAPALDRTSATRKDTQRDLTHLNAWVASVAKVEF